MGNGGVPVVTIDGPAGSGKGTVAGKLAGILGYHYLDSGVLYRALALLSQQQHVEVNDVVALNELCLGMRVHFDISSENNGGCVLLQGQDVSEQLRTEECAARASLLAACSHVREALLEKQRVFRILPGLVAEGRDMGTKVFPDADHKFFLTASSKERAFRRQKQLKKRAISVSLSRLLKEIEARDSRDEGRATSPLCPAKDAVLVDSTNLSIEQVMQCIMAHVQG